MLYDNYPVKRMDYCKKVGLIRVNNVANILITCGFLVRTATVENGDVDIWVLDGSGSLALVCEVTNWRERCYMSERKARSVRDNFRKYTCDKLLICSFENNYRLRSSFIDPDVDIITFGFQTQPWYGWFLERGRAMGMRPDTSETREIVRRKIVDYLEKKGLIYLLFQKFFNNI